MLPFFCNYFAWSRGEGRSLGVLFPFSALPVYPDAYPRVRYKSSPLSVVGHRDILIPFNFIMRKLESEIRVRERLPPKQWPAGSLIIFGIPLPPARRSPLLVRSRVSYRLAKTATIGWTYWRSKVFDPPSQTPVRKRTVFIRLTGLDVSPCGTFWKLYTTPPPREITRSQNNSIVSFNDNA